MRRRISYEQHSTKNIRGNEFSFCLQEFWSGEDYQPGVTFTILEVGRLSPSSFGFEPWKFLVIQNQAIKDKLFPLAWGAQNSLKGASHFVIILARKKADMHYEAPYITHIMSDMQKLSPEIVTAKRAAYENFQKNNFDLLSSERALFDWSCKQTYIKLWVICWPQQRSWGLILVLLRVSTGLT